MLSSQNNQSKFVTILYFGTAFGLVLAEFYKLTNVVFVLKPILIPSLMVLYLATIKNKNYWYLGALFFAFGSNVFLLFSDQKLLLFGLLFFLFYRIASIITILKISDKMFILPTILGTIPFLIIFSYLLNIVMSPSNPNFYPSVVNGIFISIFSGMGLSNYILNDNKQNSWLIISTLLFTFLVFLFMFQNFYIKNDLFKPSSALIFAMAHFAFYKFVYEAER
jgi:hypothetical protein